MASIVGVAGVVLMFSDPAWGALMIGVAGSWLLVVIRHRVVVDARSIHVRDMWRTNSVDLAEVESMSVKEVGILRPSTVLVLHLRSGGTFEIHPLMVSIGPVRFIAGVAQVISRRCQDIGVDVEVPTDIRFLSTPN